MARMPETVVIKVVDARLSVEPLDAELDAAYSRGFDAASALAAVPAHTPGPLARWPEADLFAALDAEGWFRGLDTAEATRATKKVYARLSAHTPGALDEPEIERRIREWLGPQRISLHTNRDIEMMARGVTIWLAFIEAASPSEETR